ncbi:conserved hypothetical protein [Burkholderia diffusa]|uniref:hypothetical protein n=1 Tax=Burkholderia diffusa TaxID=488732 RepID=UPI001CB0FBDC|nr:hypothetical protein [Burkholderia diffusa]CAG9266254.1 conserved hypothetical protein [Burkholderia diffusa]
MADMWIDLGSGVSQAASEASYTVLHFPRRVDRIRIKRIPFYGLHGAWREGEPGHYWLEIDHGDPNIRESYGWYPAEDISHEGTTRQITSLLALPASEGCLNGDSPARRAQQQKRPNSHIAGGGTGTKPYPWDPHQVVGGAHSISHPYVLDDRPEEEIFQAIRDYAAGYCHTSDGKWSFKFDDPSENNCHTFVWRALQHCCLIDLDVLNSSIDPHFTSLRMADTLNCVTDNCTDYIGDLKAGANKINAILNRYAAQQ